MLCWDITEIDKKQKIIKTLDNKKTRLYNVCETGLKYPNDKKEKI